ncbi:MAG TPA: hypothetical protein VNI77_08900, partial [Nitrososphaera sp.]|nr:hypothetical protein [Nitrososphaera sp.]
MANHVIVAVGGTGQIVLHYYSLLYLAGKVSPFRALVIDTDELYRSISAISEFLKLAQYGSNEGVASIQFNRIQSEATGSASENLSGKELSELQGFHPVKGIFDNGTLTQEVKEGMYARPALSAVLDVNSSELVKGLSIDEDTHIAVVGSVIGGTGGGLIAPVIAALDELTRTIENVTIRCVFFGDYFHPDTKMMPDANLLFPSNKILVLKALEELAPESLRMFAFIEPEVKIQRNPKLEKAGDHLEWPKESEPYYTGAQALDFVLEDAQRQAKPAFLDREIRHCEQLFKDKRVIPYKECKQSLDKRILVTQQLVNQNVTQRLAHEP